MKILAIVGPSGSGKTTLIERLVAEFKRRRLSVAIIKHCSHGLEIDRPSKDSRRFREAGSDAVGLVSDKEAVVIHWPTAGAGDVKLAASHFKMMDIVLIEGRTAPGIPKLELLRRGAAETPTTPRRELAGVVSDFEIEWDRPVFRFGEIKRITDFIEKSAREPSRINRSAVRRKR